MNCSKVNGKWGDLESTKVTLETDAAPSLREQPIKCILNDKISAMA